jgi:hypothetical protein
MNNIERVLKMCIFLSTRNKTYSISQKSRRRTRNRERILASFNNNNGNENKNYQYDNSTCNDTSKKLQRNHTI